MSKKKKDIKITIEEYLMQKYGKINEEWSITIDLLIANLQRLKEVRNKIQETGIFNKETYKKNPLLSTEKDLHATIAKQCQALTLTPYIQTKITDIENDSDDWLSNGD